MSRFAIAPSQLPKQRFLRSASLSHPLKSPTSFFNEPQRHRGHRERAIALPQPPKSDSYGALRYRIPPTPQTAIPTERFAIAPPQLPK
jgi:hypothetical protein